MGISFNWVKDFVKHFLLPKKYRPKMLTNELIKLIWRFFLKTLVWLRKIDKDNSEYSQSNQAVFTE